MARFIEQTDMKKIAKALIINHGHLWVLVCGDTKASTRSCILSWVRGLGIDAESKLYQDIDYAICTTESIKDRCVHWSHEIIICNLEGLISEVVNIACAKTCINNVELVV